MIATATKVVTTIAELKEIVHETKQAGKTIGLVPTMGYLHEGHLTLATHAREENDVVIMSILLIQHNSDQMMILSHTHAIYHVT